MNKEQLKVDYVVHEGDCARLERINKRLWIENIIDKAVIIIIVCLFMFYIFGTDYETYEYQQDGSGINIIGDDNKEVTYNGTESESKEIDPERGKTDNTQSEDKDA